MSLTGDGLNKAAKIIIGILLFLVGCLFLAAPVISTVVAVEVAGILLIVMGAIEFIVCNIKKSREGRRPISIITAIFKLFLGLFIVIAGRGVLLFLPLIAAVWLAAFGLFRVIHGMRQRTRKVENWTTSIVIGVLALAGAVLLAVLHWTEAVDLIGIFVAVIAIIYGFVLLMDALVKTSKKTAEDVLAEDEAIAGRANADFYELEKKLRDK